MSRRVVLATRNAGKVAELSRLLTEAGLDVELVGLAEFDGVGDIAETGTTFAANALLKARVVAGHTGLPAIADDSGLCVDALNGMPGILSARWSGRHGDDEANLDLLLGQLADTADERRGAHFFCAIAVVMPDWRHRLATPDSPVEHGEERVVEGQVDGSLLRERRGAGGFGYDPIFLPYGSSLTTAEMEPAAKDLISHRGQALRALVPVLARMLGAPGRD